MIRKSTAVWKGTGKEGAGTLTSTSGVLNETPYSFAARFLSEDGKAGTNPEELIAAAHAGCFSMALAVQLSNAGFTAERLQTDSLVRLDPVEGGFAVTGITLKLEASIPGIAEQQFQELAKGAKENCPISKLLAAVPISLEARLV